MINETKTNKRINVQLLNEGFVSYRQDKTKSMDNFLTTFRNVKPLTQQEETELFDIIRSSDNEELVNEAKDRIIAACEKFVYSIAKRYGITDDDIMDYLSEGNIGVLEAIEGYKPEKGNKFLTYAVNYIRKYIIEYKNNSQFIKRPYWEKTNRMIPKIKDEFLKTEHRYPTPDEIADIMMEKHNLKINNSSDLYDIDLIPLESFTGDGNNLEKVPLTRGVYAEDDDKDDSEYFKYLAQSILSVLPDDQQTIVKLHYGIDNNHPLSYEEIAAQTDMTVGAVKKKAKEALTALKKHIKQNKLSLSLS